MTRINGTRIFIGDFVIHRYPDYYWLFRHGCVLKGLSYPTKDEAIEAANLYQIDGSSFDFLASDDPHMARQ